MEKLSSVQIAMLVAQVNGEAGYKRSATKGEAVKRLEAAVAEQFGDEAATIMDQIGNAPDWASAQTLIQARLNNANEIATAGQNISTGDARMDPEEGITTEPAKAPKKGKGKGKDAAPIVPKDAKAPAAPRGNRSQKIWVIEGKDPFRKGTQSGDTWELMKANPGLTFGEYVQRGGRANTISGAIRNGWVSLGDAPAAK